MDELTITRLGLHGDGIAEGPVYVPRTLPGERVSGRLDGTHLRDVRIVEPSGHRVSPPCRHYKSCGGCQLQHADDAFVADWKTEVVRQALAAHGLKTLLRPIRTSLPASRRRAGFSARRTKKGALAGLHGRASDTIVEVPDCQVLHPDLLAALPLAEALALAGTSRKSELSVMATQSEAGLDIAVEGGKPLDGSLRQSLAAIAEREHLARLTWDGETIALRAPPVQRFDGIAVVPPPGAFLQATAHGTEALIRAVREITSGAGRIVDLFAGCGTLSLPLARDARLHAVEGSAEMTAALDAGWRQARDLKQVSTETRDLFRRPLLPDELAKAGAVVLDPPRAGAAAQIEALAESGVPRIAYVSCNPVTFARDVAVLAAAGYSLDWIEVVDQFRWSAHVELVACLRASHMAGAR